MRNCSDCGKPIPEGKQCVVWENGDDGNGGVTVRFICEECSNNKSAYENITKEVRPSLADLTRGIDK